MTSQASAFSFDSVRRLSVATRVNAAGLLLTAAGMLLQIVSGSTLYPSVAGPVVLVATAILVVFGPGRWTPYVGLVVPLVLGLGAIVAAGMNGGFIDQLVGVERTGIFLGSVLHVVGLIVAVIGGVGMVIGRRARAEA